MNNDKNFLLSYLKKSESLLFIPDKLTPHSGETDPPCRRQQPEGQSMNGMQ